MRHPKKRKEVEVAEEHKESEVSGGVVRRPKGLMCIGLNGSRDEMGCRSEGEVGPRHKERGCHKRDVAKDLDTDSEKDDETTKEKSPNSIARERV